MKLTIVPNEFKKAAKVLQLIKVHGFDAYFVGGSVRDALLDKPIHDVDIATSAYPAEIKQIFPRTIDVGIEHGTVLALVDDEQYEITTFRAESTYQDFRRPDEVTFVRSLKEDLKRRDFTINALALEENGEIIDLFDGLEDLSKKVIRAVGNPRERFHEDALRMMRALRFASQLDFAIERETLDAIETYHPLLAKISVERITIEFTKLLLGANRRRAIQAFVLTECYQYCPGLRRYGTQLLNFSDLPADPLETSAQAWTLLLYILGLEADKIRSFLKEWKLSNQLIQSISTLLWGLRFRLVQAWTPMTLYQLGVDNAQAIEKLLPYFGKQADLVELKKQVEQLPIRKRQQLAISGSDLLLIFSEKPGKWVGSLLDQVETAVVQQQVENQREALLQFAQQKRKEDKA